MANEATPPVPGSNSTKKALSPLAWVAIGCGGVIVVGVVIFLVTAFFLVSKAKEVVEDATGSASVAEFMEDMQTNPAKTAAETMIRLNPELGLVATDDEAGTITFRNKSSGEEATLNFEDIAAGRFSMTTSEGELSIDASGGDQGSVTFSGPEGEVRLGVSADLSGVPDWVPIYPGATDTRSVMSTTTPDGVVGVLSGKTSDDPQAVVDHFTKLFEDRGYQVAESMTKTGGGTFGSITGKSAGEGRTINVVIVGMAGESQVTINYNEKKR